ncbi:hypothetical protein [Paracoccus sp. PAR01]|uniref:hypothetical protein n=1 Tax=Paracoccus sp. PAR01 TaxID=2769282 RepID=UPI0017811B64|nr:hypothetical protein [Paracoccus sp. PAR01]MBD9528967.1 hypothetical protein [Paracoccus sp. PAR01]
MDFEISNPRHVAAGVIDVTWNHPDFGVIPYTCVNGSGETEMQAIWDAIQRGEFGPVAGAA